MPRVILSYRVRGIAEVEMLTRLLLTRFLGCAHDEYTMHHWTIDEIQERRRFEGRLFFDAPG